MQAEPDLMLQGMWSATFNLPPNDPRLLRLSAREALDQMILFRAAKSIEADNFAAAVKKDRTQQDSDKDPYSPNFRAKTKTVTGAEAEKIADHQLELTGNAEWDAVELAETDPMREPFDNKFVQSFLRGETVAKRKA